MPSGQRFAPPKAHRAAQFSAQCIAQFIDVSRPDEVRYWSRELGVDERRLRNAVETVGPRLSDIRRHIEEIQVRQ